ncbi:MAG TPA: RNA 2',3'-cyclic phosphodiesterase [Pedococcus sp.]|jgi:2'-5' RNA ligase|uniref:RNA 2',3'-cyclic phosphodiesterase n=1 Tax=Pedococcus sp. TaxID=2860345 RepID=UPI002F91E3C8
MRMFVAVVPPDEVVESLAEFLEPRREAGRDLRWTDPEQWHLTLAFMPDVPDRVLDDLVERLARVSRRHEPVPLRLAGAGAFPNPYASRVLWAGLEHEGDGLRHLARGIRGVCAKAGAAPQGGPFHPHITLARTRRPVEASRWLRVLELYAGPAWVAREVTLIASHLGEGRGNRPRYEAVATLPLGRGERR